MIKLQRPSTGVGRSTKGTYQPSCFNSSVEKRMLGIIILLLVFIRESISYNDWADNIHARVPMTYVWHSSYGV